MQANHFNSSWDYAINWGCYVNGFYTDDTCTTGKFPGTVLINSSL